MADANTSNNQDAQALLANALTAIRDLRRQLREKDGQPNAPVAIVGMSCRLPGCIDNPEGFWSALEGRVDGITEVPRDRWYADEYYDPEVGRPGKICTKLGGFLAGKDLFDARFFRIAPREAMFMDPQHRIMLELAWEALEHANIAPDSLYRTNAGVFVGASSIDYGGIVPMELPEEEVDPTFGTGVAHSAISGRISYTLGLQGPSMTVDTACSSSLVAASLACMGLRARECDLTLVGGVNLMLSPFNHTVLSAAHMLSPEGSCRTFDDAANGYVRSEGGGVVVLKLLDDAIRDGDRIIAVIRGCAVNQDGPSSSLTAPNGPAQQAVIRKALANAGLEPAHLGYIEAHGTGTALGDPIELNALAEVFGASHTQEKPLMVGSVKANLGHMEPAAGIVGLIKLALQLQHHRIPPQIRFETPTHHFDWGRAPIQVNTETTAFPRYGARGVGAVSSFGFTGTNAHLVLEEAPPSVVDGSPPRRSKHLLCLSARSKSSLDALTTRYIEHLRRVDESALASVCHSANAGRSHFANRRAVVFGNCEDAVRELERALETRTATPAHRGPKVAFIFTGQGSQYAGMGRRLFETEPTFRAALTEFDALLQHTAGIALIDVLYADGAPADAIHQTRLAQPCIVAIELGIVRLLRSWGIGPASVLGHSIGEFAAASTAGVLSEADALRLVAERGRLMQRLEEPGKMLAITAEERDVSARCAAFDGELSVAAINGPRQVVVSGAARAIETLAQQLHGEGVSCTALAVSHAFHSRLMEPMLEEFERAASTVAHEAPAVEFFSCLSGEALASDRPLSPHHWVRHASSTVRYADALKAAAATGIDVFLEIGPKPTLSRLGARALMSDEDSTVSWQATLDPTIDDSHALQKALANLYESGAQVDWRAFGQDHGRRDACLPTYAFERESYWFDAYPDRPRGRRASGARQHPLLGTAKLPEARSGRRTYVFEAPLQGTANYIADHQVFGHVIFPAAGYVELALAAAACSMGDQTWTLTDCSIEAPLVLDDDQVVLQTILETNDDGTCIARVMSRAGEDSTQHFSATLHPVMSETEPVRREAWVGGRPLDVAGYYARVARDFSITYGPAFRGIREAHFDGANVLAQIALPQSLDADRYHVHPVILDSAFQLAGLLLGEQTDAFLPIGIARLTVFRKPGARSTVQVRRAVKPSNLDDVFVDVALCDRDGSCTASIEGLHLRRTPERAFQAVLAGDTSRLMHRFRWLERDACPGKKQASERRWLLFADEQGLAPELNRALRDQGASCAIAVNDERASELLSVDRLRYAGNLAQAQQVEKLFELIATDEGLGALPTDIVYLRPLDVPPLSDDCDIPLHETGGLGVVDAMAVLRAVMNCYTECPRLTIVTRGAQVTNERRDPPNVAQAVFQGLSQTVCDELSLIDCRHVDLDPILGRRTPEGEAELLARELLGGDSAQQIAFRGPQRLAPRLEPWRPRPQAGAVDVLLDGYGSPDNLRLTAASRRAPASGEVEIAVHSAGLNFKDVLLVWGILATLAREQGQKWDDRSKLGFECAGVVTRVGPDVDGWAVGDEVIGIGTECLSHHTTLAATALVRKPAVLDFHSAAALPTAFLTAYYALITLARVKRGDKVLVHAAAGGVGQAALGVCRRLGAEVYATASVGKWDLLRAQGVHHIMNSRSLDFKDELLHMTGGRGVDVVLNSLSGDFIDASLEVLAHGGRFVEIGKRDVWSPEEFRNLRPDAAYFVFDLGEIDDSVARTLPAMLEKGVEWINDGSYAAPPVQVFPVDDVREAFRHLAEGRNVGKVVIEFEHDEHAMADQKPPLIRADANYLITGGLGAIGLHVADWLQTQGARHLTLASRRPPVADAAARIARLRNRGVNVDVVLADVAASMTAVESTLGPLFSDASRPLAGIIHAAGVMDDEAVTELTSERCLTVMTPKVLGSWNLHRLSRDTDLDFFVCFSSQSGCAGSARQGPYAAANTFMDRLMQRRRFARLPGLSVAWGAWRQGGMAAEGGEELAKYLQRRGSRFLAPRQCLATLQKALERKVTFVLVAAMDWNRYAASRHRFPEWLELVASGTGDGANDLGDMALAEPGALAQKVVAMPVSERQGILLTFIRHMLARALGYPSIEHVEPRLGFFDLGVNSLSAQELKTRLEVALSTKLNSTTLLDYTTPEALSTYLCDAISGNATPVGEAAQ